MLEFCNKVIFCLIVSLLFLFMLTLLELIISALSLRIIIRLLLARRRYVQNFVGLEIVAHQTPKTSCESDIEILLKKMVLKKTFLPKVCELLMFRYYIIYTYAINPNYIIPRPLLYAGFKMCISVHHLHQSY